MGDYPNQIPVYKPLKYKTGQLRAGLHGVRRPPSSINIYHKETTVNNFGGGFMMDYGYYNPPSLTKAEKWGLAVSTIFGGLGAILGAIFGAKKDGKGGVEKTDNSVIDDLNAQIKQLTEDNKKLDDTIKELKDNKPVEEPAKTETPVKTDDGNKHVADAEEVKQEAKYAEFNVTAQKIGDNLYRGYTGYNIVAAKYKAEDGTPLTHGEIMAICNDIFKGKALPTGKIQLPMEVEVNGKKYTYDKKVPDSDVKPSEYALKKHETYKSSAVAVGSKYAPTVDGKRVGSTLYETREEAVKAAEEEIANKEKEENK